MFTKSDATWRVFVQDAKTSEDKAVVRFARRWAVFMEEAIEQGETVAEVAKRTSLCANYEGLAAPGFDAAVKVLIEHWEFGDDLCRWYRREGQACSEGIQANENRDVLNFAALAAHARSLKKNQGRFQNP